MAHYLKMPKLSDTMAEGKIASWSISEGDEVELGTEIAEIETDKATMAWESSVEGIVHKIYVPEGGTAVLGSPLVLVLEEGEDPPADADSPPQPGGAGQEEKSESAGKDTDKTAVGEPSVSGKKKSSSRTAATPASPMVTSDGNRVKASPLARKVASERGVDLSRVRGSGPGGRIVKSDLDMAPPVGGGSGSGIPLLPDFPVRGDEVVELSGMRRVIAERLLESKTTIPHFYLNIEMNAEPLMELRAQVNSASLDRGGPKYTVNDFIMRAVVLAAREVPEVNASFDGDRILQYGSISLAVAVAIDGGLVTPVIREAENKSMLDLSEAMKDLATRARDRKLTPDEMQGGTITISNLGSYGIQSFDAIINPPQAAILSIGAINRQPVVNDRNEIVPGMKMWIGMSCDHRVIDGAVGATYLRALQKYVENPVLLVS